MKKEKTFTITEVNNILELAVQKERLTILEATGTTISSIALADLKSNKEYIKERLNKLLYSHGLKSTEEEDSFLRGLPCKNAYVFQDEILLAIKELNKE